MNASRVAAVRAVHRSRDGAGSGSAYSGYLAAMTLLVVVLPVLRALVLALGDPLVSSALAGVDLVGLLAIAAGATLPAAVLLGRARGPAVGAPYPTAVLLETDVRRWLVLRRSVIVSATGVVLAGAVSAVAVAVATGSSPVIAALAGAAFAVLVTVAWLAGQCLPPSRATALAGVLALPVVAVVLPPALAPVTPGGLLAVAAARPSSAAVGAMIASVALAALAVPAAPRLLDAASGPALLSQSLRWESARRSTATGDLAESLTGYRALPRRGRSLAAVRIAPFPLALVVRDAVGALRTPGRSGAAALALLGAGVAVALASVAPPSLLAIPATAAGILAYLGAGVWADGFRHAADTAGQTAFVAPPPFELLLLHGVLPVVLAVVLAVTGAIAASAALPGAAALAPAAAVAVVAVAARAMDATRGALPPALLSPVPLPIGDGAGAMVVLWNLAGALVSAGAAVALLASPLLLAGVPLVAAACLLVARGRLARP
ncbi:hypothetical protein SAMN06295885_2782 [Rathayibacter oskolensis]|uniref:ABC-2 type transport system permease protein n=1 Tax=Rathayibacter oskolensis TaxID=1891671 RepID=A0A1X7P8A3_9MICO|nr:hypothetical protein [Rathayibacter oskolensis]SMH46550.1 hypothetical protein SAMN06295885_2782 [Rathayibacter oskolensis]